MATETTGRPRSAGPIMGTETIERPRTAGPAMGTETIERPRAAGPGEGVGGNWQVIVLNDDHNTFDHVARTLASTIPGINLSQGHQLADTIHNTGRARVWSGPKEPAEHYWEQLKSAGLTMAPLEQH